MYAISGKTSSKLGNNTSDDDLLEIFLPSKYMPRAIIKNPKDSKTNIFKFLMYIYLLFLFLIPSCLGIKNISRIKRTGIKKVFNMFI